MSRQRQIVASGPKHRLFERPQTVVAARLTGCKNIVAARPIAENRIAVAAWQCELQTAAAVSGALTHVGVRSHQLLFRPVSEKENTFPCWLMATSEAPHEMTLYLRLHSAPKAGDIPHLQADLPKDLCCSASSLSRGKSALIPRAFSSLKDRPAPSACSCARSTHANRQVFAR